MLSIMLLALVAQGTDVPVDLGALSAPEWSKRAEQYEKIVVSPNLLQQGRVKKALVALLILENKVIEEAYVAGIGVSGKYGEEYSAYYDELVATVSKGVDDSDVNGIAALAHASYNADSVFAARLAEYGEVIVAPLLAMAKSEVDVTRWNGLEMLGRVLGTDKHQHSRRPLTATSRDRARTLIRGAASAPDAETRIAAVNALLAASDSGALPLLERLAASDPSILHGSGVYPVRDAARFAIDQLRGGNRPK